MCDERERLIGFVYDECDAGDRRQIEGHLESCATCRQEIAGLRSVREDLLAWSVPEHEPVWRPLPVAVATPWWRQTPGWAFAAAASVVLMAGVAGGAATQALRAPEPVAPAGVTAAQLDAVEAQILQLMRSELDRVRLAAPAGVPAALAGDRAATAAFEREPRDETGRERSQDVRQREPALVRLPPDPDRVRSESAEAESGSRESEGGRPRPARRWPMTIDTRGGHIVLTRMSVVGLVVALAVPISRTAVDDRGLSAQRRSAQEQRPHV